jgi:hypothetical protein
MKNLTYTIETAFSATPSRNYCENQFESKEEALDYLFFHKDRDSKKHKVIDVTEDSYSIEHDDETITTYSVKKV